jgi:hypothetical protein
LGELGEEIERLSSVDRLASTKEKLPDVLVRLLSVDEVNYGLSVRIIQRLDSKAKTGEEGVVCVMDGGVRGRGGDEYKKEGRGRGGGEGGTGDDGRAEAGPAPAVEPMHKMLLKDIPRAKPLTLDDDSKPQLPCIAASHTRVTTILALSIKMEMRAFERYAMRETARYVNSLLLEDCNLRDDGAGIIAAALGKHVHFTNTCRATLVSLSNNFITWRGVSAIAGALKTNTRLTALHLDWNTAGAEGGVAFARALKGNSTLRLLNLEACGLRDEGVSAIGHALAANRGLIELRISADNATSGGAVAVASSLRVNTALEILDISGNSIGSSSANGGGYQIATAIAESNSTLTDLKVDACGVEAPFFDMISNALKAPRCALRSSPDFPWSMLLKPDTSQALQLVDPDEKNSTFLVLRLQGLGSGFRFLVHPALM